MTDVPVEPPAIPIEVANKVKETRGFEAKLKVLQDAGIPLDVFEKLIERFGE